MPRTNPPSYDLLVVLRATLSKLEARRRPLSSRQEILKHALELRIREIENLLCINSPVQKRTVSSARVEDMPQQYNG
jgi:hypothetical protein